MRLPGSGQSGARRQPGEVGSSEGKEAQRPTVFSEDSPSFKDHMAEQSAPRPRCLPSLAPATDLPLADGLCPGSQVAQVPVSAQDPVLRTLSAA